MNRWLSDRWHLLTLVLLTAALGWRLVTLADRPLWFDEAFTWRLTRFGWGDMLERLRQDFNPPLYYLLLKGWTLVLGDSVFALRLLSVAWFVVLLGSAFLLCREVTAGGAPARPDKDDVGLLAVLFLAASSLVFRFSQETRMYSQAAALMALSSWLLLRALREPARPVHWWLAYGLTATALVYTHTFAVFGVVGQVIFLGGMFLYQARGGRGLRDRRVGWSLLALAIVALCYLPWLPVVLDQQRRAAQEFWTPAWQGWNWQSFVLHCFFAEFQDPKAPTASCCSVASPC
jgi:uncharacterized membrane protein